MPGAVPQPPARDQLPGRQRDAQPAARGLRAGRRRPAAQQQAVDEEVAAAVAAGLLAVADPGTAARAVVTLCTAIPQWYRPGGPTAPEELAEQYVGFALALLGRPPSTGLDPSRM
ncbi:TetR/AcrR family transcriptional regulator C-terminal domain-containing protein [Klenkia terrae]|uniref:TetR/AcrR family transcriptional regulator C-terminal domain-containing protein n=1 Tax=Klenkia terrae TaxID=1052259 RepID=UPI00361DBE48